VSRVALALSDCRAICGGVEKGDLFHRPIGIADEVARVPSRDRGEFALGHLILSNPEVAGNRDRIFDSHERSRLDQDHVGQGNRLRCRWDRRRIGRLSQAAGGPAVTAQLNERDQDARMTPKVPPREGTRPTTSCRPGPLTRRRGFMSPCMEKQWFPPGRGEPRPALVAPEASPGRGQARSLINVGIRIQVN